LGMEPGLQGSPTLIRRRLPATLDFVLEMFSLPARLRTSLV